MRRVLVMLLLAGVVIGPAVYAVISYTSAQRSISDASQVPNTASILAPPKVLPTLPTLSKDRGLRPSVPSYLAIPKLKISAPVTAVHRTSDGSVGTPPLKEHNLAGWYDESVSPGENGPSLIDGHVNGDGRNSVFANLKALQKGDLITVTRRDGATVKFQVTWVQITRKSGFPWDSVLGWTVGPTLRLVTCGGPFNYSTGHYRDNVIVYADLI